MDSRFKRSANDLLENIGETLDITDTQYGLAENRYKALGEYLTREESILKDYNPSVHPQGSFLLGTVVKPLESDEFDIDLVCQVDVSKTVETQKNLKEAVGHEVKNYAEAKNFTEDVIEGKRCWTLEYAKGSKFHMDVLPATPDTDGMRMLLEDKGHLPDEHTDLAIAITDNTETEYHIITDKWPVSNPKGYHEWFKGRMQIRLDEARKTYASRKQANVEDVPDYKVKTPLQRAIQLLKRHRDLMFTEDMDNKPISIIITTLAGHAYNNEDNVVDALESILDGMAAQIENRFGVTWIANPVNPLENFADKWATNEVLEFNFYSWLSVVKRDFEFALASATADGLGDRLKDKIGTKTIARALNIGGESTFGAFLAGFIANVVPPRDTWSLPKRFWPHRQEPEWPVALLGTAKVRGYIGDKKIDIWNEFYPSDANLPVGKDLRFEASTDITPPYKAYWQVTNTGYEAASKNELRGTFEDGEGENGMTRIEATAYSGLHWIACFIVKDGLVVARSEQFYVHIE